MVMTRSAVARRGEQRLGTAPSTVARHLCRILFGCFMLFAVPAYADADWIDELPTVTTVARAVAQQLQIDTVNWNFQIRGIALKDDDDLFAVYMAGTLVLLRQVILYKYQEETPLPPEREGKLR